MRRTAVVVLVGALALAGLALPAGGQTSVPPPPVVITSIDPACGDPVITPQSGFGAQATQVTVTGTSQAGGGGRITVLYQGKSVAGGEWSTTTPTSTTFTGSVSFAPSQVGYYEIVVTDAQTGSRDSRLYSVPCRSPSVTLDPPCSRPGRSTALTVLARDFAPPELGYVYYDYSGPDVFAQSREDIPIDDAGNFTASFTVVPLDREVRIFVTDRHLGVTVRWAPCPPPGVTTTQTTAPPATTTTSATTITVPPTVTVTLPPGRTTTSTTSTTVPPATPGASLTVTPGLGPPGFVALAAGAGFPPGPVELTWSPGIGATAATAAADGTFSVRVLIFPRDRLGPRLLAAVSGEVSANAPFLVVPSTLQPSGGGDVAQINRARRFIQR